MHSRIFWLLYWQKLRN